MMTNHRRRGRIAFLLAIAATFVAALQLADAQVPANPPVPVAEKAAASIANAKSEVELDQAFGVELEKLDADFRSRWQELQRSRLARLQKLIDESVEKKDLDVALDLREKAAAIEAEIVAAGDDESRSIATDAGGLQKLLRDTTWQWGPTETVKFQSNGLVANAAWTSAGLTTTWRAIDRRTVVLYIASGRNSDRYATLLFGPDAKYFTQFSFDGREYNPDHRIQRVKRR